jgi:hypothetical protein
MGATISAAPAVTDALQHCR